MNQYIFRGKRKDGQGWVEGDHMHGTGAKHGNSYIHPIVSILPQDCHPLDGYEVDPETVGLMLFKLRNAKAFQGDFASFDVAELGEDMPEIKYQKGVITWMNGSVSIGGWNRIGACSSRGLDALLFNYPPKLIGSTQLN